MMVQQRLSVLLVAHDAKATGGVNNFLRIMRGCYRDRVSAFRIANGPRSGARATRSRAEKAWRMVMDYLKAIDLLKSRRFEILHVNPTLDLSSTPRELVFVWLSRIFAPRTKVLVFFRGWNWPAFQRISESRLMRAAFLASMRRADRVLVLSDSFRQALISLGVEPSRVAVVTTMFDGESLKPSLATCRKRPQSILFLSRFLEAKGGRELIQAFRACAGDYPAASLTMAGDGPEYGAWKSLADSLDLGDRIRFTGYIGGEAKMNLLASAEIFALPTSHWEGLPNAILEAMASSSVIIAAEMGGIAEVVSDPENGTLLSDTSSVDEIERALRRYLNDEELCRSIGASNASKAWGNYEASMVSNKIADHYEAMMA